MIYLLVDRTSSVLENLSSSVDQGLASHREIVDDEFVDEQMLVVQQRSEPEEVRMDHTMFAVVQTIRSLSELVEK